MDSQFILTAFLVLGACGAAGMAIAKSKNRDAGEGLALGLILGIFGVLIAAVLPSKGAPPPPGLRAIRCPRCNADQNVPIEAVSVECWQCRLPLNPHTPPPPPIRKGW